MTTICLQIRNLKSIRDLNLTLPVEKGIYAITGENGSGKTTLISAASLAFYNAPWRLFGKPKHASCSVEFHFCGKSKRWTYESRQWKRNGALQLKGFFEGSVFYGNRFRDNDDHFDLQELVASNRFRPADEFIAKNMGVILHNDATVFKSLSYIDRVGRAGRDPDGMARPTFFNMISGQPIASLQFSTGENLLLTILYSLWLRVKDRTNIQIPYLLLLDEIELALHPSSLKRLVTLLKDLSERYNMAVYFSTHSLELISIVEPKNIFFIEKFHDGQAEILNPCYPAYATKMLYDHQGYDTVILVEDDLAKTIVDRILRENRLLGNKMVHVMPCGGWTNVLKLANDVVSSNLLPSRTKVVIVLDEDIKQSVPGHINKLNYSFSMPISFIPMESLEKYIFSNLVVNLDTALYRLLNDYIFHKTSLRGVIDSYRLEQGSVTTGNGKEFYRVIKNELEANGKSRSDLIEIIVNFIEEKRLPSYIVIVEFLNTELA